MHRLAVLLALLSACSCDPEPPGGEGDSCPAALCADRGLECGRIATAEGCIDCGRCRAPDTCGGGGVPNHCGCAPASCASLHATCGAIADGCGGTVSCGSCTEPESCGGARVPNACGHEIPQGGACAPDDTSGVCAAADACCFLNGGFRCLAKLATDTGTCPPPRADLVPLRHDIYDGLVIEQTTVDPNDCAVNADECAAQRGDRRLLRFRTVTANLGSAAIVFGDPKDHLDLFMFSRCHGHFHLQDYARYRLLDMRGQPVATAPGVKVGFCLEDSNRVSPSAGPQTFSCRQSDTMQGISVGWADDYPATLPCQWIDITGVRPGDYQIEIHVNPERRFPELDYSNNVVTATITIPPL